MKRIAVLLVVLAAASVSAFAQAPQYQADDPTLAAPAQLRANATVVKWKPDFTYDTVKQGTNDIVCYDLSGKPEQQKIMYECTNKANLDRVAQNLKAQAGGDRAKTNEELAAEEKGGTRVKPQYGSVWYHMMGADPEHLRMHMTIAVPGATSASTGLPDNNKSGGVWIMNAGTTTAHLMTPGE